MTDAVPTLPTTPAAATQAAAVNGAVGVETNETTSSGEFQNALLQQLQGLSRPATEVMPAIPAASVTPATTTAVPVAPAIPTLNPVAEIAVVNPTATSSNAPLELLQTLGDGNQAATAAPTQDGTPLPVPGQHLPPDPTVLADTPPQILPEGNELAAALLATTSGAFAGLVSTVAPRSNLSPIATALAQVSTAPRQTSNSSQASSPLQTANPLQALFAAMKPQQETVAVTSAGILDAELPAQTPALPATTVLPAGLNAFLTMAAAPAPSSAVPAAVLPTITVPVAQPGWDQALGQRVQWLVSQQLQGAELRLTPAHLGPIEVRISIGHDQQTVVNFASPHAAVRDAIEAAVPRLRDMLGNNGQDLVNVNVSQHSFAEQRRQAASSGAGRDQSYIDDLALGAVDSQSGTASVQRTGLGLVDYFA